MSKDEELYLILEQRGGHYGEYAVMAAMTQRLKEVLASQFKYKYLPAEQKESLEMICLKMARIVCGDHTYPDSWRDIAGYAELIVKSLKEPGGTGAPPPPFVPQPLGGGIPPCTTHEGAQTPAPWFVPTQQPCSFPPKVPSLADVPPHLKR